MFCSRFFEARLGRATQANEVNLQADLVQGLTGARGRFGQLCGQKTLNKIVLFMSEPNGQATLETADPMRSRPHSRRHEADIAVLQKLLEHEPEIFHAGPQPLMIGKSSNSTNLNLPLAMILTDMNGALALLETDVQLVKRNPLQGRVGCPDA